MRKNISYKNKRKLKKKSRLQKKHGGSLMRGKIDSTTEFPSKGIFKGEIDFTNTETDTIPDESISNKATHTATSSSDDSSATTQTVTSAPDEKSESKSSAEEMVRSGMSQFEYMKKPPLMKLADHILYTLYTLAGIFIYYPSYFANIPDNTLENIVPTDGGCKILFGDERVCKRKIKCFFKKCSMMEDPIGYKLDKELQLSIRGPNQKLKKSRRIQVLKGGRRVHKKYSMKKKKDFFKHIPRKIQQVMKKKQKQEMKEYYRLYKSLYSKKKKQKGGELPNTTTFISSENQSVLDSLQNQGMSNHDRMIILNALKKGSLSTDSIQEIYDGKGKDVVALLFRNEMEKKGLSKGTIDLAKKAMSFVKKDESQRLDQQTCMNKVVGKDGKSDSSHIFCNPKSPIEYNEDELGKNIVFKTLFGRNEEQRMKETVQETLKNFKTVFSVGKNVGYDTNLGDETSSLANTEIVEDFVRTHFDKDSVYRLLMIYKMLDKIFDKTITYEDMKTYGEEIPREIYGVDVTFPWKVKNEFINPEERRKCLFAHLTKSNLGDDYKSKDLYEKCFVCKNCTLANTSFKVWDRIFSNLFKSSKENFIDITHDLFQIMGKHFKKVLLPIKQYYLVSLLSMNMVNSLMELKDLKSRVTVVNKDGDKNVYSFRDLILGIPQMDVIFEPTSSTKDQLRDTYMIMKSMNLEDILYDTAFKFMFKKLQSMAPDQGEERLNEIKKQVRKKCHEYYGRQKNYMFIENNHITFEELNEINNLNNSETLQSMFENPESASRKEINDAIESEIERNTPLFELVLNRDKFEDRTEYENAEQENVKKAKDLIRKLNEFV